MREIENACKCKVENDSVGASTVITKSECLNEIVRACACVCVCVSERTLIQRAKELVCF